MVEVKDRSKARKNKVIEKFKAENKGAVKVKAKNMEKSNGMAWWRLRIGQKQEKKKKS